MRLYELVENIDVENIDNSIIQYLLTYRGMEISKLNLDKFINDVKGFDNPTVDTDYVVNVLNRLPWVKEVNAKDNIIILSLAKVKDDNDDGQSVSKTATAQAKKGIKS